MCTHVAATGTKGALFTGYYRNTCDNNGNFLGMCVVSCIVYIIVRETNVYILPVINAPTP